MVTSTFHYYLHPSVSKKELLTQLRQPLGSEIARIDKRVDEVAESERFCGD